MYEAFYGFKEKPFSMLPDPGFLFLSKKHRAALTLLEYGLLNQVGFCVISGEPGAGKTTILRALLERVPDNVTVGLITNTHQSFGGLLDWILSAFDLHQPNLTHVEMHQRFMDYLIEEYANNRSVLLIIDEAQNMKAETLEELRMLSNVNSDKDQLMQVMLAGQPALKETLRRPELMQFAQRIAVDYHLEPLGVIETCGYIQHRLVTAGAERNIFTPAACERIHCYSGGTPRLINLLCETVLVYGFADQLEMIDVDLVDEMVQERMKDSVVPIINRDAANKDNKQASKELEQDFPWIKPKSMSQGLAAKTETVAVINKPVSKTPEKQTSASVEKQTDIRPADNTAVSENKPSPVTGTKQQAVEPEKKTKVAEQPPVQQAAQQTRQNTQDNNVAPSADTEVAAGTAKPLVMRAIIATFIIAALIVLALFSGGNFSTSEVMSWVENKKTGFDGTLVLQKQREHEEERVKKLQIEAQALKAQREQEEARVKKLQIEAMALKKERDEAIAKAEEEKRAAEKAALAVKDAENKRKLEENKRLAEDKERKLLAKQKEANARAEADRVKREAAKQAEEKRLIKARLKEEKKIKQQQKVKIRAEQLAEVEAAALAAAKAKEEAETKAAECSGPAARYKASCR